MRLELNSRRSNDQSSVAYYNNQFSEIDANAFGTWYMMKNFKVKPLFHGLDEATKRKIFDRAKVIEKTIKKESER